MSVLHQIAAPVIQDGDIWHEQKIIKAVLLDINVAPAWVDLEQFGLQNKAKQFLKCVCKLSHASIRHYTITTISIGSMPSCVINRIAFPMINSINKIHPGIVLQVNNHFGAQIT
jgi:hypothetical protein